MTPLNWHDLSLLYILKSDKIANKAIKAAAKGADLFPRKHFPHLACMWEAFLKARAEAKKQHKEINLDNLIASALDVMPQYELLPENQEKLKELCNRSRESIEIDDEVATDYIKRLVLETVQRQLSRAVVTSAAYESIKQLVEKGDSLKAVVTENKDKQLFVNPLMNVRQYLKRVPKRPTGVVHFDTVTNGGMSPGELCLIAGLMGGGKSMTTIQLVGSQLLINKAVGWITYEQPFDQDLMQRLVSFLTGYELDSIRNSEFDDLPDKVKDKFEAISSAMSEKLIATDFSDNKMLDPDDELDDGTVYSIRKRLEEAKRRGIEIEYLIVDWLGAAVKNIARVRNIDIGVVTNYIAIANDYLTDLVQLAKDHNLCIVLFHQLDPSIKKSPPSRKPTSVELQMIHSAANWVQYAIVIGKQDENKRCWFICDKNRTGPAGECVIELDGAHAKFKLLRGYAPGRNGQFVNMAELEDDNESNERDVEQSYGGTDFL